MWVDHGHDLALPLAEYADLLPVWACLDAGAHDLRMHVLS